MKHKKVFMILFFIIFIILVVIMVSIGIGAGKLKGFNNQKEAEKFILQSLHEKYGEKFKISEIKKYKEEKIGIKWIQAKVHTKTQDNVFVYARNTGLFEDTYHITFFKDEIYNSVKSLCENKDYIQKYEIEIVGNLSKTQWTGEENLEEYIEKSEYIVEIRG